MCGFQELFAFSSWSLALDLNFASRIPLVGHIFAMVLFRAGDTLSQMQFWCLGVELPDIFDGWLGLRNHHFFQVKVCFNTNKYTDYILVRERQMM